MHPVVHIFSHRFLVYDIMTVSGLVFAFAYLFFALNHFGIPKNQIFIYLLIGLFVQFFGGMVIPFLYQWIYKHQTSWLDVLQKSPGRYFHSVFLSMIFFTLVFSKVFRWPAKKVLDRFMIAAMVASALGRIGCLMQPCCMGKPTDFFCSIRFPRHPDIPVHPVQIYMFILESIIALTLWFLTRKPHRDGEIFWKGLWIYSIYRFLIEFLRTNPIFIFGLTHAQVFSLLTLGLSIYVLSRKIALGPISKKSAEKLR